MATAAVNSLRLKMLLCLEYDPQLTPLSQLLLDWLVREPAPHLEHLLDQLGPLSEPSEAWLQRAWALEQSNEKHKTLLGLTTTLNSKRMTRLTRLPVL